MAKKKPAPKAKKPEPKPVVEPVAEIEPKPAPVALRENEVCVVFDKDTPTPSHNFKAGNKYLLDRKWVEAELANGSCKEVS